MLSLHEMVVFLSVINSIKVDRWTQEHCSKKTNFYFSFSGHNNDSEEAKFKTKPQRLVFDSCDRVC